jgi:hypothetical protein
MKEITNSAERLRPSYSSISRRFLTTPKQISNAEYKPAGDPSLRKRSPEGGDLLTPEEERVMAEHLPIVRLIDRRIHERLPQHVPIEDLYSAYSACSMPSVGSIHQSKFYSAHMRNIVSVERFSTVCGRSTGVPAS